MRLEADLRQLCGRILAENTSRKRNNGFQDGRIHVGPLPFADDIMGVVANIYVSLGALDKAQLAIAAVETHIPHEAISEMTSQFVKFSFKQLR